MFVSLLLCEFSFFCDCLLSPVFPQSVSPFVFTFLSLSVICLCVFVYVIRSLLLCFSFVTLCFLLCSYVGLLDFFSLWFFCVVLFLLLFAGCSLGSPAAFSDPAKPSLLRLLLPVSLLKLSFVSSTLRVKLVHLCGIHPLHSTHLGYMQSHPFKAIFQYWFLLSLTIYTTSQSKHSLQL